MEALVFGLPGMLIGYLGHLNRLFIGVKDFTWLSGYVKAAVYGCVFDY